MAEEACSVLFLQVAVLPLDGGVSRSAGVDLPPTARPRLCGAVRLVSPLAGVRGTADPAQEPSMDAVKIQFSEFQFIQTCLKTFTKPDRKSVV